MWCYHKIGVTLPHSAAGQYAIMKKRPLTERQPGDVLFWMDGGTIGHCAIYIGNDQIVEAPEPGKNVQQKPYAYWKAPMSQVGMYTGPGETNEQSNVNITDTAINAGTSAENVGFFDSVTKPITTFFSFITDLSNWKRAGLYLIGTLIVLYTLYKLFEG